MEKERGLITRIVFNLFFIFLETSRNIRHVDPIVLPYIDQYKIIIFCIFCLPEIHHDRNMLGSHLTQLV